MRSRNLLPLLALSGALAGCPAKHPGTPRANSEPPKAPASVAPASAELGARIYGGNCAACHQQTGTGIPGVYPALAGSSVVTGDPAELALWVIRGQRPGSMPVGRFPTQMLQFGWMKPADAAALFTYLRSNFGNAAPSVDAATVARALGP
jgi:mono/diheme cytochrome c family protein